MDTSIEPLLDPAFLKKLARLSLVTRRPLPGLMKGEKRSTRRGSSIEFADFREYEPGDDLRYVDWNSAARLDRMYLKLFVEEEDLYLALLVDTSRSMSFGSPSKVRMAAQLAAALGSIALLNYDRVSVQPFAGGSAAALPTQRGRAGVAPLLRYLQNTNAAGDGGIAADLRRFAATSRKRGVAVVLSDLFDPGWEEGLKALLARGFQVTVAHVLADDELEPALRGDLRIIDSETGETREMSVSAPLLARYRQALAAFCADVEGFCHRYGLDYLRTSSSASVEDLVLQQLRRTGSVR